MTTPLTATPLITTFLDLTEDILEKVTRFLDLEAIFSLRKVCRDLRNYLQDKTPNINLMSIQIEFRPDSIYTCYECDQFLRNIEYHKHENGCSVEVGIHQKILENSDFQNIFFNDLQVILNHQKSILSRFEVDFENEEEPWEPNLVDEIYKKLEQTLSSKTCPLKVKNLKIRVSRQENLLSILQFLDPKYLAGIQIHPYSAEEKAIIIDKAVKLEQWKSLKLFDASTMYLVSPGFDNFLHLEECYVGFTEVDKEDMMMVKKNFFTSTTPLCFRFTFKTFNGRQQFLESLGPVSASNPNSGLKEWYIQINDSDQVLHIHQNELFVNFDRTEMWKVPKRVNILK